MARFWKRDNDRSIEQLLRANRPEPREEFAASVLSQVGDAPARAPRRAGSPRRLGLALALTIVALAVASVLGGISAASAGLSGIAHVAKAAVTPSHTSTASSTSSTKNEKNGGKDNDGDKDDKGKKCDGDNDADDKDCGDHDGDHHQYKVGVCHWVHRTHNHAGHYVLIFVSQHGAAEHLKHHQKDKLPVNGHC